MNKDELVTRIAERASVNKKTANEILDAVVASIIESVATGEKITLVGFGTFDPRERAAREGRNPQTGKTMTIPATRVPAFSAGKVFKDKVASGMGKGEPVGEDKTTGKEDKPETDGEKLAIAESPKAAGKKK